jgi:hypothetical protein
MWIREMRSQGARNMTLRQPVADWTSDLDHLDASWLDLKIA